MIVAALISFVFLGVNVNTGPLLAEFSGNAFAPEPTSMLIVFFRPGESAQVRLRNPNVIGLPDASGDWELLAFETESGRAFYTRPRDRQRWMDESDAAGYFDFEL
jgi:hypothetical protein